MGIEELNQVCPYFTMFPLTYPLRVLRRADPGDTVIDPFVGRGTTLLAARQLGLRGIGVDSHPVAGAISAAKIASTQPAKIVRACKAILDSAGEAEDVPEGEFWQLAYQTDTLHQICKIRESLLHQCSSQARIALRAIMLGALHGPIRADAPWYFSNQMPRTYASKPGYSARYWTERNLKPPKIDVLDVVKRRASKYFAGLAHGPGGRVVHDDSRIVNLHDHVQRARWIVTSPPYYGMNSYVSDQWIRSWFVGGPQHPSYTDNRQLPHSSARDFAHQLSLVWRNMASYCETGARMFIRFGGINDRKGRPDKIIKQSIEYSSGAGWQLLTSHPAGSPNVGSRQASQFRSSLAVYAEERDYSLALGP